MAIHDDHLQAQCARTGRTLSIPVARVEAIEPTRAVSDVVTVGGERVPVRDAVAKLQQLVAELSAKRKKKTA